MDVEISHYKLAICINDSIETGITLPCVMGRVRRMWHLTSHSPSTLQVLRKWWP
jgi:hypothetical protein